jgi:hypothetical protein
MSSTGVSPKQESFTFGASPPPPPPHASPGPQGWRKFFAIAGIIFAFPFFLTIPGWKALSAYRKWREGERAQPTVLIVWGITVSVLIAFAVIASLVPGTRSSSSTLSPPTVTAPATHNELLAPAPAGFTAAALGDGWTQYASNLANFSIALPRPWRAALGEHLGPHVAFSAFDSSWGMFDSTGPQLDALQLAVRGDFVPKRYYHVLYLQFSLDPHIVGNVDTSRLSLSGSRAVVFRFLVRGTVLEGTLGGSDATSAQENFAVAVYDVLHGTEEYRLVFMAPEDSAAENYDVFDSIARTFSVT